MDKTSQHGGAIRGYSEAGRNDGKALEAEASPGLRFKQEMRAAKREELSRNLHGRGQAHPQSTLCHGCLFGNSHCWGAKRERECCCVCTEGR